MSHMSQRVSVLGALVLLAGCASVIDARGPVPATGSSPSPATAPVSGWTTLPDLVVSDGGPGGNLDAVSVDDRVVIVGGRGGPSGFGASPMFDFSTRAWSLLAAPPATVSWYSPWVWDGHEILVFDSEPIAAGPPRTPVPIVGYALDPRKGTWRTLRPSPPWDFEAQWVLWTGSVAVLTSDANPDGEGSRFVMYNPSTDTWGSTRHTVEPPNPATPSRALVSFRFAVAVEQPPGPSDAGSAVTHVVGPAATAAANSSPTPNPGLWVVDINPGDTATSRPAHVVDAPFPPWELVAVGDRVAVFDYDHTKLAFWTPADGAWGPTLDVPSGPRMSWQPRPPGPIARWTGSQLVVWGGVGLPAPRAITNTGDSPSAGPPPVSKPRADGVIFTSASATWALIPDAAIPVPVAGPFASVWARDRLFAWSAEGSTIHAAQWLRPQ